MRCQSTIQSSHTFFLSNESEALDQTGVFRTTIFERSLTETGTNNLKKKKAVNRGYSKTA